MRLRFLLVLFSIAVTSVNAALPIDLTGREYSEAVLILSPAGYDVRVAAKSMDHQLAERQPIVDLLAEVTRAACSGSRRTNTDTLSWLIKTIGGKGEARYAALLDHCLARVTDREVLAVLSRAKGNLDGATTSGFHGGSVDLEQTRTQLLQSGRKTSREQVARTFETLHVAQPLDEIYTALGAPDEMRAVNFHGRKVGHTPVSIRLSRDMIVYTYHDLGTLSFAYNETQSGWILNSATHEHGLFWDKDQGRFLPVDQALSAGDGPELRKAADYLLKQPAVPGPTLVQVADRIYRSQQQKDDDLADSLAWLCRVLARSGDGKYKSFLQNVSDTAAKKTLRKYAKWAADQLPESTSGSFSPTVAASGEKSP